MLTNIKMLLEACQNLNVDYEIVHPNQNLVKIKIDDREYYFTNYSTPLTPQSIAEIFKDKQYFYQIFHGVINMPTTISFVSPYCDQKYQEYLQFSTIEQIIAEIEKELSFPVIVKRNRGSGGNNVFRCFDRQQIQNALETVFNVNSKNYDYVVLAQKSINIVKEYRCVCLDQQQVLLYDKDFSQAEFTGNLSPLHWQGAIAKQVCDRKIITAIDEFIRPIFEQMTDIAYVGLDIAVDDQGVFWLIEANSHPNFDIFLRDNGKTALVEMFEKIVQYLK
ncbi:ATP-grasp domain-containing protein [Pseudanabaena mucicola]|uniref:Alpha-L-glutamate ligase n=1 Tax=Pseudanabaena mucicola FACHB-723 TaxID=2692860 RepID=A0ABR7ZWR0_9CYAN|nr:YheC/YheD family protein [Pseudanabaena mucicola]MBD2188393.1 alpha-L-glutamate ligase [Pseudanabaena mucicola FACHB-723]